MSEQCVTEGESEGEHEEQDCCNEAIVQQRIPMDGLQDVAFCILLGPKPYMI